MTNSFGNRRMEGNSGSAVKKNDAGNVSTGGVSAFNFGTAPTSAPGAGSVAFAYKKLLTTAGDTVPSPSPGPFSWPSPNSKSTKTSTGSAFSFGKPFTLTSSKHAVVSQKESISKEPRRKVYRASLKSKTSDSLEGYEHYRSFMDKLAESGVDDYIDLPMIAVMGDTSSGKSSLLSNISLVELPSSDTLTTRCPIRLQMRNAKERTACVKVVWKDRPEGGNVDFGERAVAEENWGDITNIIAEAQEHIIEKSGKEVARDIVSVECKGPHCENLTLIDLPGIVRSTGKGESDTLAEDVRALMQDYLYNGRCIILAVHPSNVDFHNSQILAEAKKVDPETSRTIPVLTKPDLIDDGAEKNVQDLLLGNKTDKFEMGFHMVKARGQKDLNDDVSIEGGLEKEEAFFRNNEPWRSVGDKSKFGTKSLRTKLAGLQMRRIHASFELITSEMKDARDEAALNLKALGGIPSTLREKRALFRKVKDEIREGLGAELLSGRINQLHSSDDKRPSAQFHSASKRFQDELNSSRLANVSSIQVGTRVIANVDLKEVRDDVCFVDDDNVYVEKFSKQPKPDEQLQTNGPGTAVKSNNKVFYQKGDGAIIRLKPIPRKLVRSDPQWISELIEHNRPYSLPIFPNPDLFASIVADQIEKEWKEPTMQLVDLTASLMETSSEKFINRLNMIKSLPSLSEFLVRKSSEVIDSIRKDALDEASKFVERERTPYTQNHYLFENLNKLRTKRLMDEVLSSVHTHSDGEKIESTSDLALAIQNIFERNQKLSNEDHMAEEMERALDSYGKVAFKRFVDSVPMICVQIMQRFPKMFNDVLSDVMDNEIEQLVVAPADAIANMIELKKEVETLEKGIDTVKGLSKGGIDL